jgi:hypothetical protein
MSLLSDYCDVLDIVVQEWIDDIDGLSDLLNVRNCPAEYLPYLAKLLNLKPPSDYDSSDSSSVSKFRAMMNWIIDWYKMKGSYQSIQVIALVLELDILIYDMYTNDYVTFVNQEWFVGKQQNENPPGLDSSYYKSPHFGIWIKLNKVYISTPYNHLWLDSYLIPLQEYVEKARPAHTVPHYTLYMNPQTDIYGTVNTVDGNIITKFMTQWVFGRKYFDQEALGSGEQWNFDDESHFDTSEDAWAKSLNIWVLGTGNKNKTPGDVDCMTVETPTLTGTIADADIVKYDDYWSYTFTVPKATIQSGISEVGIYHYDIDGDVLAILGTFPDIDKDDNADLRITIFLYKKQLA